MSADVNLTITGTFTLKLDDKGRITLPKTSRDYFKDGIYITRGPDHSLYILPFDTYNERSETVNTLNNFDTEERKQKMLFFGGFLYEGLDSIGRILLVEDFRKYANLNKEAVLVGVGDGYQLWDNLSWANYWNIEEKSYLPNGDNLEN